MSAMFLISRLRCASTEKYALLRSVAVRTLTVHRAKGLAINAPSASRRTRLFARQNLLLLPKLSAPKYVFMGATLLTAGWICYCEFQLLSEIENIRRDLNWLKFLTGWSEPVMDFWTQFVKDWAWPESWNEELESLNAESEEIFIKQNASFVTVTCLPIFLYSMLVPWSFLSGALMAVIGYSAVLVHTPFSKFLLSREQPGHGLLITRGSYIVAACMIGVGCFFFNM